MKILLKIDRYHIVLVGLGVVLALFVGLTLRNTLNQLNASGNIKNEDLVTGTVRINRQALDESFDYITSKKSNVLDLKD
ncbi:MAG: hypothetical protein US96_C0053G0007 [Candidatus Woesebacteria bacterium GW2011_GWB1_38_5b]|uniref:Uncharacterized protein n=1 Tax=Candidatus Woesebacteria bacterium GW2011_GWB1_38_5b TaxID=1618569 RepID=A0A0G0N9J0_9BACT|nr:MAG: hypothetical protein US96_C0053G0007 [Candidatus Woesebacteria bacterium GW2011_GWB1_38_5b]